MSWIRPPEGQITENFSWAEAACRCCGRTVELAAVLDTALMMEKIRERLGNVPIKVLSWCRCPSWNSTVGGASNSFHIKGMAVDFAVKGLSPRQVQARLKNHDGGCGAYLGFTHLDRGPKRRWSG